ncbi:hypothetical protein P154DRAFT_519552 [Amniculicola lignicola CBS 123094]|uniref:2EXR domain-containing protein n=1 Tax=Amniculicola lignicola CBS 123094 TaxID=1392246 RepID=A0A6A5WT35_9PLEO|nr:hypothetical protein P154DRAFT_519552 [Amniculicola lignicola CBS 123094]
MQLGHGQVSGPATSDASPSTFTQFLNLPRELRDMVYAMAMEHAPRIAVVRRRQRRANTQAPQTPFLPPICFANRQTFSEAAPVFVRTRHFTIVGNSSSIRAIMRLLRRVPDGYGFQSIRSISLTSVSRFGQQHGSRGLMLSFPSELISQCSGLRRLILELPVSEFINIVDQPWGDPCTFVRRSLKAVKKQLRVDALFESKGLETLHLRFVGGGIEAETLGCNVKDLFKDFLKWFKREWRDKMEGAELRVRYLTWDQSTFGSSPVPVKML